MFDDILETLNAVTFIKLPVEEDVVNVKKEERCLSNETDIIKETGSALKDAAKAVAKAINLVARFKSLVNNKVSTDEIVISLNLAIKHCAAALNSFGETALLWNQIQGQSHAISRVDIHIKNELFEEIYVFNDHKNNPHDNLSDINIDDTIPDDTEIGDPIGYDNNADNKEDDDDFKLVIKEKLISDQKQETELNDAIKKPSPSKKRKLESKFCDETNIFTCDKCEYVGKSKRLLSCHSLMHGKDHHIKKFQCSICNKAWSTEANFKLHTMKEHGIQATRCCECKLLFVGESEIKAHRENMHPDDIEHSCRLCIKYASFYTEGEKGLLQCNFCTFSNVVVEQLRKHIQYSYLKNQTRKVIKCEECEYTHGDNNKIREHIDAEHKGIRVPCTWEGCDYSCKYARNLKKHIDNIHRMLEFSCHKCTFKNKSKEGLAKHQRKNHPDDFEKYYCDECTYIGATSTSLNLHITKIHTNPKNKYITSEESWDKDGKKLYKCDKCSYVTRTQTCIYQHRGIHEEDKFFCDQCEFSTAWNKVLKAHIKDTHQGNDISCDVCGFVTTKQTYLYKHKKKHQESKHICAYEGCSHVAAFKSDLKIHIEAVHEKVRHECPECSFTAAFKGDLNRHIKKSHGDPTVMLKCERCVFTTTLHSALVTHIQTNHDPELTKDLLESLQNPGKQEQEIKQD